MTLTTNLSLGELGEAMAPRFAESFPGRNRPRKKTHEIVRYGAGMILTNIKQKILQQKEGNKPKWSRRRTLGVPGGLPMRPGGRPRLGPLELLSCSTRAWNFPNFAKTLKIKLLLTFTMFPYRNT